MPSTQTSFSINGIILRSTKIKMIWVYTRRVITSMAYFKSFTKNTSLDKQGNPVSSDRPLKFIMPKLTISSAVKTSLPKPAFVWLARGYLLPKSVFDGTKFWAIGFNTKRITCSPLTLVMKRTKTFSVVRIEAVLNTTFFHKQMIPQVIGDLS